MRAAVGRVVRPLDRFHLVMSNAHCEAAPREDLPVRRQPGSSTSSFSFATSTPVVRRDHSAPRRLQLSMSPVSPCTTASQKTVIRLLMVEETFETNFFFLRAGDRIMPMSMETPVEIDHF